MSALQTVLTFLEISRSHCAGAAAKLMESWRDQHADVFDRDVLTALDRQVVAVVKAVQDADHELDRAEQALRTVGESLRR